MSDRADQLILSDSQLDCSDDYDQSIEAKPYSSHHKTSISKPKAQQDSAQSTKGQQPNLLVNTFFSESRTNQRTRGTQKADRATRNSNGDVSELRSDILLIEESPTAGFDKLNEQEEIPSPNLFYPPSRQSEAQERLPRAFTGTFSPIVDQTNGTNGLMLSSQDEQVQFMAVNSVTTDSPNGKNHTRVDSGPANNHIRHDSDGQSFLPLRKLDSRRTDSMQLQNQLGVSKIVSGVDNSLADDEFVSQADKSDLIVCLNQIKSNASQRRNTSSNQFTQNMSVQSNLQNQLPPRQTRKSTLQKEEPQMIAAVTPQRNLMAPTQIARSAIATPHDISVESQPKLVVESESRDSLHHRPTPSKVKSSKKKKSAKQQQKREEYSGLPSKQGKVGVRQQNLLGRGHCSLSISSINSGERLKEAEEEGEAADSPSPKGTSNKPNMEQIKNVMVTVDYDEAEFVSSTQEGGDSKLLPYDQSSRATNQVRGITPQRRLLSCQKMGSSAAKNTSSSNIQASTVGSKAQFQSDIKLEKVEPKRSFSVSAKESAAELQLPYNRRALLLRERKEQLKQQARENSFQRSQRKQYNDPQLTNDSLSRLNAVSHADSVIDSSVLGVSHQLGGRHAGQSVMFNTSSMSGINGQQTQISRQVPSGRSGKQIGHQSLLHYEPLLNQSGYEVDHFLSQSNQVQSTDGLNHSQQPVVMHAAKIQPGNQQQMSQSVVSKSMLSKPGGAADESSEAASGIERAKQLINQKLQRVVEWGQFASSFHRQDASSQPETQRTFGQATQRAINRNEDTRNLQVDLDRQVSFGLQKQSVFTPPAGSQFKLAVDDQGRIVPATVRDNEGEIPNPKKTPTKLAICQQQSASAALQKNQQASLPSISRNSAHAKQSVGMTLNPNNQHGVAITSKFQQHSQQVPVKDQTVNMYQRRLAVTNSTKSTKSLRDLLTSNQCVSRASISRQRREEASRKRARMNQTGTHHSVVNTSGQEPCQPHLYSSVYQVDRSPPLTDSLQKPLNPQQALQLQMTQDERRRQQEEYPCSAFFQNDENFERSHRTETSNNKKNQPAAIAQQFAHRTNVALQERASPMRLNLRRGQEDGRVSRIIELRCQDSEGEPAWRLGSSDTHMERSAHDQFITCIHPAGNTQGEENGMLESVKHRNKCESPQLVKPTEPSLTVRDHNTNVILRNKLSAQAMDKAPQQQISLTARKNLTHHKMTPLVNKLGASNNHQMPQKVTSTYHQHMSPKFMVVSQQQRNDMSAGRCSINSLHFQQVEEDLPPDPSLQTRTIDPDNTPVQDLRAIHKQQNQDLRESIKTKMIQSRAVEKHSVNYKPPQRLRTEIMAVAPKQNQMSMVDQASSDMSILITESNQEASRMYQSNNMMGAPVFSSSSNLVDEQAVRSNVHRPIPVMSPSAKTLAKQRGTEPQLKQVLRSSPLPKRYDDSSVTMIKVDEEDEEGDMQGLSESEKRKKKRENSFIRDGYEIYVEGTYIVNGRKKKKIKKRKLSKAQLEQHARKIQDRALAERAKGNLSAAQQIEQELKALGDIGKQTLQMQAAQKVVTLKQSQVSLRPSTGAPTPQNLNMVRLNKQTVSQSSITSPQGKMSPRLVKKPLTLAGKDFKRADLNSKNKSLKQKSLDAPQLGTKKQVTKVKVSNADKTAGAGKAQVQVPRSLVSKKSPRQNSPPRLLNNQSIGVSDSLRSEHLEEEESKTVYNTGSSRGQFMSQNHMTASNQSINIRDPELQLQTSARLMTLQDASNMLGGAQKFILHRMIFKKHFAELLKVFRSGLLSPELLNEKDHHGNTPLLLAAKLSASEEEYLRCINFLFKEGCDGKIRDGNGWSILDEAISQLNSRLLAIAFNWLNIRKKEKIERNKAKVLERLQQIPDFYCELHWECQSSWIPFLSKIAPSDNFQIWKVGSNIRLDFSLVGFKKLQNKRRRMSILFRNAAADETDARYKDIDILMVNRDRQILSNPLEDLDDDEKLAVLTDIMNADPVQNELNIVRQEWAPIQNFFGTANAHETINEYDCSRYKLQIQAQVRSKKKLNQRFEHTYESYFEGAEQHIAGHKKASDPTSFKMAKDVERTVESQLWLSQEFPLQFQQFMEVLDTLAISGQASMQKINEFLQNDCLKDVVNRNGFPVKIQVPIGMIVKAMVTFGNFQFLNPENKEQYIRETFQVPDYCRLVSRKEGMKTMESRKKRLAVANVVI